MRYLFVVLSVLTILIISCHRNRKKKILSSAEFEKLSIEFSLPKDKSFQLDKGYIRYLFSFDTLKYPKASLKNHYQPVQASYYNKEGKLVSFHVNCYAAPGIKEGEDLKWNRGNAFSAYLPKSVAPLDTIISLSKHLQFIRTFDNKEIDTTGFSVFDNTVIIHWGNKWLAQDCKNLIHIVKENLNYARDKKVNLIYVNNDNWY
jgi:hypothetical protein